MQKKKENTDPFGELALALPKTTVSVEELARLLQPHVLHLMRNDRKRLMQVLYRMDVDEQQVRQALRLPGNQAAVEIATLMALRYRQKADVISRQDPSRWKDV
ncbi:MAG: hypothetical protein RMK52_06535 [Chitinophagales bacterium]|nr:hypothetical protein [Chitinophagales bacterium]MDW8393884.1 hypothetical protein [Chitinophagales bacterium]